MIRLIKINLLFILFIITLTGCGKIEYDIETVQDISDSSDMVYKCINLNINGYEGSPKKYKYKKDRLFFLTDIKDEKEDSRFIQKLYSVNIDGSDLKEISIDPIENEYITDFDVDNDDILFNVLTYNGFEDDGDFKIVGYSIIKSDMQGKREKSIALSDILKDDNVYYITITNDKKIVVVGDSYYYCFDTNLHYIDKIKPDKIDEICGNIIIDKNDRILGYGRNANEIDIDFSTIDFDEMKTSKIDNVHIGSNIVSVLPGFEEFDFCYLDMEKMYGYNIEERTRTVIMDFLSSNISWEEAMNFIVIDDGQFVGTLKDGKTGDKSFIICEKQDCDRQDSRIELSYGTIGIEDEVYSAIREFNQKNEKYRIVIKDYMSEEDPLTKMNLDIVSGNAPDIIDLAASNADELISKGVVEDLTPYINADEDIEVSDYIPSILKATKKDDKIYYVAPKFFVSTLVGRVSDVGLGTGWTFEEFKKLIKEKSDEARPFVSDNRIDIFESLIDVGESDYINWDDGICSFDSDDYKEILNMSKKLGIDDEVDYGDIDESEIMNGKVLFLTGFIDITGIQMCDLLYDGEYNCIGYPNKEKNGSFFFFPIQAGIYSKSENKEGAWEFLRIMLSKEYQGLNMSENNIPTRQDCFDLMLDDAMTDKTYINAFGKEIHPREAEINVGHKPLKLGPLSQQQADAFIDLINSTTKVGYYDDAVTEILLEEAQDYFNGKNSLDKAVEYTQNRVNTYVNEKR